ncbi:MAG: hypothetical protein E7053_08525 [Lentisphaerae bacterium]|nr:hypothetical protein [Lentisphaerota bacterium]
MKKMCRLWLCGFFGVWLSLLMSSCAALSQEDSSTPSTPRDRFAFLRRGQSGGESGGGESDSASSEEDRVSPGTSATPVLTPEQMARLGVDAAAEVAQDTDSAEPPKFYEDLIALNADEEIEVSLVFNSAPLLDVLSAFGDLLEFNFVAESTLNGVVTLNLNCKMTRRELWNTFDRMLFFAGAGARVEGSLLRIVSLAKMAAQPDSRPGETSEIYYRQLHNATAAEVAAQLAPFVGAGAIRLALARPNAIMVCDTPENMPKIRQIIEHLDASGKAGWPRRVIACEHVLPNRIANELQEILPVLGLNIYRTTDRTVAPGAVQIVGLDRMRMIVISAATQEAIDLVAEWIRLLDVAGSEDQESVFVYKVRYNKAAHLARALSVVFETQGTALTIDASNGRTKIETITSPVTRTQSRPASRAASRSDAVNVGTNIDTDQDSKIYGTTIRVFADGVLNRLVLRCTPRTYASVRALLDRLDVVPAQVLLQVLMVEVTLTESTQFGLEFSGVASHGGTQAVFGTNYGGSTGTALTPFGTDAGGNTSLNTGSSRQNGLTFGLVDRNDPQRQFGYIRAAAGNGQVKVISSPQLLVSSHTEARIQVGQDVPIVTGSVTSSDGGTTSTSSYENTGIMLTVTPYVTSTDLISLDILQVMSQATVNTLSPGSTSPIITKREIETSMTIANGQTMVLGGLIQERTNDSLDSLPFINRIPFLRRLFGSTSTSVERTEVLVLITGHIVNEHSELDELIRRYNDAVEALNEYDASLGDNQGGSRSSRSLDGDALQ